MRTDLLTAFMADACIEGAKVCDGVCETCVFDNEEVFKGWLLGELMVDLGYNADNVQGACE